MVAASTLPKDEWLQVSFDNVMHNSLSEGASVPLEDLKKEGNTYVRITCLAGGARPRVQEAMSTTVRDSSRRQEGRRGAGRPRLR